MRYRQVGILSSIALGMVVIGNGPAFGQLAGTATISDVQSGPNYNYTVQLKNTSASTDIGTFWFAWTPPGDPTEYDFLPTAPSVAGQPTGWIGSISPGFPGTSIEFYNNTGSAITPGQTGTFTFTTTDSPATLQGFQFGSFPITDSFIYAGAPEVGSFAQVNPVFVVPEPSSIGLLAVGCTAFLARRRNRKATV